MSLSPMLLTCVGTKTESSAPDLQKLITLETKNVELAQSVLKGFIGLRNFHQIRRKGSNDDSSKKRDK